MNLAQGKWYIWVQLFFRNVARPRLHFSGDLLVQTSLRCRFKCI